MARAHLSGHPRKAAESRRFRVEMREIAENADGLLSSGTSEISKPPTSAYNETSYLGIWNRAILLFAALCSIKFVMLFDLQRELFEAHFRVAPESVTWLNTVTFYLFALLVGLNLWAFAVRCERGGVRVVRCANACVLALSGLFVLLTFAEHGSSYLSAVMNAYLGFKELKRYLITNFCFRPPFLAIWMAGYALIYYGLFRKQREYLILRITAICATLYIILCLRNLLWYHENLLVLDCIGLTTFLGAWKSPRRLHLVVPIVLFASMMFFYFLFRGFHAMLTWWGVNREFLILTAGSVVLFTGVSLLGWRWRFFVSWSWILPFAFPTFLLFVNTNYSESPNYSKCFCTGLTLPRYFLGEFGITVAWLLIAWTFRRWRPKGSLLCLDIVLLMLIGTGAIDLRLMQIMSVRLDWYVLSLAFGETPKMIWRMSESYLPSLGLALAVTIGIYAGLLAMIRRADKGDGGDGGDKGLWSRVSAVKWPLVGCVLLGLAGASLFGYDKARGQALTLLATTSPFWQHVRTPVMDPATFARTIRQLGIWRPVGAGQPTSVPQQVGDTESTASGSANGMNVVIILQESTYNKFLSLFDGTNDTEPLLSKYKDRMELFPNFYSSFAGSINARFASFTGLYPVTDFHAFTAYHVPVKSLFETLHDDGYSNSLFYSSFFDYTGFRDFLHGREVDEMYDADSMPGQHTHSVAWGLREDETLNAITNQIERYAVTRQKFCLTYVPAAPHNPFDGTPTPFKKYPKGARGNCTNPYLNELLFMDSIIATIVGQLKDSGLLDKTLIVITGDHGEMLGENGGPVGHGWAFTPELGNVPLIIMNPARHGYHVNGTLGSQIDILPTLLDLLGIPQSGSELYEGTSLYSANADPKRTIYLNTYEQFGILESGLLFCGNRNERTRIETQGRFFSYTNNDAQTIFRKLDHAPVGNTNLTVSISDFDRFQANFLRNYLEYCRMIRESPTTR